MVHQVSLITRHDRYKADDIGNVGHWAGFNLTYTQQQFGAVLAVAQIADKPVQPSPPRPINSGNAVQSRIDSYLTYVLFAMGLRI